MTHRAHTFLAPVACQLSLVESAALTTHDALSRRSFGNDQLASRAVTHLRLHPALCPAMDFLVRLAEQGQKVAAQAQAPGSAAAATTFPMQKVRSMVREDCGLAEDAFRLFVDVLQFSGVCTVVLIE
eukprot:SAG25_NODE_256_length_10933_cov_24.263522_17_plen_127_part_00